MRLCNSLASLSSSVSKANLCYWRALMPASLTSLSSADSIANLYSLRALMCASLAALFSPDSIVSLCFRRALYCVLAWLLSLLPTLLVFRSQWVFPTKFPHLLCSIFVSLCLDLLSCLVAVGRVRVFSKA